MAASGTDFSNTGANKGPRFPSLSDDEVCKSVGPGKHSKNTQDVIKHSVNILTLYGKERNTTLAEVEQKDPAELCEFLRHFYAEARQANGDVYAVRSMISLRYGLTRHFQSVRSIDISNDKCFQPANDMFQAVMRRLRAEGKGVIKHKDPITKDDMIKIRKSPALDVSTPRGLQNKVFVDVLLYFCDCGRDNLREMKKGDLDIAIDSTNRRYIYMKKYKKGRYQHGDVSAMRSPSVRMYESEYVVGGCPVKSFCTYLSRLDPSCQNLWQRPKAAIHPDVVHWYENAPLGKNTLGLMMVKISTEAKCSRKYTNHCLRATTLATLDAAGFDGRHAMTSSTYHRPESPPRTSRVLLEEQKQQMSRIISELGQSSAGWNSNPSRMHAPVVTSGTLFCQTSTTPQQQEDLCPVMDASWIKQEYGGGESSNCADYLAGQDEWQFYSVKMEEPEEAMAEVLSSSEGSEDETASDTREEGLSSRDDTVYWPVNNEPSLCPTSGDRLQGETHVVLEQTDPTAMELPEQILYTGQEFSNYQDFQNAVELYECRELCELSTDNCRTVGSANKLLRECSIPYAEKFKYSYIRLRCKLHRASKGHSTVKHPNQRDEIGRCPMNFSASVDRGKDKLVIMHGCFDHHHDTSYEDFMSYPEDRQERGEEMQTAENHGSATPNHPASWKVIQHDVHSLRSSLTTGRKGPMLDAINEIVNDDPTCNINLVSKDDGEVIVLYLQTTQMLRYLRKFPEVIMCDTTYNVNQNKMPLYTFFVVNGNGESIPCAHTLIADEKEETLRHVLKFLKESGGDPLQDARIFLIDANFDEAAVVKEMFPHVKVHLCMFQVLKTFKKRTQMLPPEIRDIVRKILQEMVYTKSKGEYEELHEEMEKLALGEFKSYFNSQWHICKHMWVPAFYGVSRHFGNRTAKRLEGLYQTLKAVITPNSTIAECLKKLIFLHGEFLTDLQQHRASSGTASRLVQNSKHPKFAEALLTECTPYAAEKMLKELCRSCECKVISVPKLLTLEDISERNIITTVVEDEASYTVSDESGGTESCSCHFSSSMGLPCRHIFCSRDHLYLPMYESSMVPERWKQTYQLDKAAEEKRDSMPADADMLGRHMNRQEKMDAGLAVGRQLATALSETNHWKFGTRLQQLKELVAFWMADKDVTVKEVVQDGSSEIIDAYYSLGKEREPPDGQESTDTITQTQTINPIVLQPEESSDFQDVEAATCSGTWNCHKRKAKLDTACANKALRGAKQVDKGISSTEMLL